MKKCHRQPEIDCYSYSPFSWMILNDPELASPRAFRSLMCPGQSLLDTVLCQSSRCMQANVIHVPFVHAFIAALLKHGQVRQPNKCGP